MDMGYFFINFFWYYVRYLKTGGEMEFTVIGKIQPKQRPRFKRCGAFIQTYTPKETLDYQKRVAEAYSSKYDLKLTGALRVEINAFFNVPKSYSKKRKAELWGKPNTQHNGDIDNVAKSILDGLNGVAWEDDTIVYDLHITKWYVMGENDPERVEVKCQKE